VVKGIHLEGLRVVGDPTDLAHKYFAECADEIFIQDIVASLYGLDHSRDLISEISVNTFLPITVGGGIRSANDAVQLVRSGADRVALNTAAVDRPGLITEISRILGKQAVVLSVEAKKFGSLWEVLYSSGRDRVVLFIQVCLGVAVLFLVGEIHLC
jgi:cyclase